MRASSVLVTLKRTVQRLTTVLRDFVFRQLSSTDVAVVREVYDSDNSEDIFRMELERALEVGNILQVQCTFVMSQGIELSKDWMMI